MIDPKLLGLIRGLLVELASTDVVEFVYETAETKVLIRKQASGSSGTAAPAPSPQRAVQPAPSPVPTSAPREVDLPSLRSPLTGVFYRSPKPGAPPFVQEGEQVDAGTVVGLVEAMKVFNEIRVEEPCRIVKFFYGNGELVYKDQPLLTYTKE